MNRSPVTAGTARRSRTSRWAERLSAVGRRAAAHTGKVADRCPAARLAHDDSGSRGRSLFCRPISTSLYFDNYAVFSRSRQGTLLSTSVRERIGNLDPYAAIRSTSTCTRRASLLNQLLYADTKTYLHELLMKQDQMSMAASIESRVPFLDHPLMEFAGAPGADEAPRRDDEIRAARGDEGDFCPM